MSPDEKVQNLSKWALKEHAKNIIVAAISGIPVIGGPLSSLLSEYLPDWKVKKILKFIADLSVEIKSLEDKIDKDYLLKEDFAYLFETVFLRVLREYRIDKIEALKTFLINACVRSDVSNDLKEYFLSLTDRLESVHMHLLSLFWNQNQFANKYGVKPPNYITTGSLRQTISTYVKPLDYKESLWESAVRDLDQMGLFNSVSSALRTMMTPQGATELKGRMTELGKQFCGFVLSY